MMMIIIFYYAYVRIKFFHLMSLFFFFHRRQNFLLLRFPLFGRFFVFFGAQTRSFCGLALLISGLRELIKI